MKTLGLILGVLLFLGGLAGAVIVVLLPEITNNRINFNEAVIFLIPAALVCVVGFIIIMVSGYFVAKSRQRVMR